MHTKYIHQKIKKGHTLIMFEVTKPSATSVIFWLLVICHFNWAKVWLGLITSTHDLFSHASTYTSYNSIFRLRSSSVGDYISQQPRAVTAALPANGTLCGMTVAM